MPTTCTHLDRIRDVEPRTPEGCEECLKSGDRWIHLRLCLTCGHVGCCNSSPNKHATKHFHATQHPIVRSFESNEDWSWCYVDQAILEPGEIDAAVARNVGTVVSGAGESGKASPGGPGGLLSRILRLPYRRNYVVGVVDDDTAAKRVAESLQRDGFSSGDVVLQSGNEISERLQREDLGNLVREAMTEEGSICRDYDEMARSGAIVSAYTRTPEEVEDARRTMSEHGAHSLKHFGDWTISDLSPGSQAD